MTANQLREKFISFFKNKDHIVVPASSLIPENDPSVLFTTAGMQQFRKYYLEPNDAPSSAVVTIQPCVRTSDIDEVGDESHLTFFEMMGNFSFGYPDQSGSYFKEKVIKLAWDFLVSELGIEPERIFASYFNGNKDIEKDKKSFEILSKIKGLKIEGHGFDDNFWSLGTENSPGGPTVEFYVDGLEVWNLVFNEYIFKNGKYMPSKFKGVDTGMGLERLLAIINDAENFYHTELFEKPHRKLHELLKTENPIDERIILDHIKASVFIINEKIEPSNKLQGYILRRLIRRAIVRAKNLGIDKNFTSEIAKEVIEIYPNYKLDFDKIKLVLDKEEVKFRKNLEKGIKEFDKLKSNLDGKAAFKLYETYGFPIEMIEELTKENNIKINRKEFEDSFKKHQELSRTASAGMFKGGLVGQTEITTKYHTATHLLLAALRKILGDKVFQKGSNITDSRLRFDFSYPEKLTPEQIKKVEDLVNEKIKENLEVKMEEMPLDEAKKSGAVGEFVNKYGDKVKVYSIGSFSKEICGGPHVDKTGELGIFKIIKEESSSAGTRRIKAILK